LSKPCIPWDIPLLGHHQDALDQQALEDLRPDALEQAQRPFVLNDKLHNLDEALERLPLPRRGRLRLQADLGHDQGLGDDGGKGLGHGAES
jgi:hypothetical protein